jgi:hypothetical protein
MGHGPHPTSVVTTRSVVGLLTISKLVGDNRNYPKSTQVGLLGLYPTRTSM